jgi:phospholipid/cholesterol/gamma-HCH transport system permease protein
MIAPELSPQKPWEKKVLRLLGGPLVRFTDVLGQLVILVRQTFFWLKSAERQNVIQQVVAIGTESMPVTMLTSLFTGMVLALQTGYSFKKVFNEPLYVGTVVGMSLTKELGPVLTAIVVSGRVGAAIAAELGTMKVTEQIDALYTLGTNPIRYLAVPRFIACVISVPILSLIADCVGVVGGLMVAVYRLGVPRATYITEIERLGWREMSHGLVKSVFFAAIIAVISCYKGFTCEGGAEGVGKATTSAVVVSMVLILVTDYFLSAVLVAIGIS